jgi:hypothetical protein
MAVTNAFKEQLKAVNEDAAQVNDFYTEICRGGTEPVIDERFLEAAKRHGMHRTPERRALIRSLYAQATEQP